MREPSLPLTVIEDPDEVGYFAVASAAPVPDEAAAAWWRALRRRTWHRLRT